MLSLLNPLAFWLSPLLAVPLIIHFLGRTRPKPRDFPSVLLVRGKLAKAMRRKKLRNRWLLLLRTLLLLCLFLSAGDLVWRPHNAWPLPALAGLLSHNGAYARIPYSQGTYWEAELNLQKALDSLTEGHSHTELSLQGLSPASPAARFGSNQDGVEAFSRMLSSLTSESRQGETHLFFPIFSWNDFSETLEPLALALEGNKRLRAVFLEVHETSERLSPFLGFEIRHPRDGILSLHAELREMTPATAFEWRPSGGYARELVRKDNSLEILHPFSGAGWMNGMIRYSAPKSRNQFAFPEKAVSLHIPPPATWCHVGSGSASLASLGREGPRQTIKDFMTGRIPIEQSRICDFLFLADPEEADEGLLAMATERARRGGKVVLSLGPNSDLSLLNRALLVPLGMGRLTALDRVESEIQVSRTPAGPRIRAGNWGKPGTAKIHVTLLPDSGTTVLLTAGGQPILVQRSIGSGSLLVWTTSLDNEDWSDLGLGPWPTLMHQSFAGGDWESGTESKSVDSDSLVFISSSEEAEPRVFDDQDQPFTRVQKDPSGWRLGPFDRLGLYRVAPLMGNAKDTSWFSVQLPESRLHPENQDSRIRCKERLGRLKSQTAFLPFDRNLPGLYGGRKLRLWILALAALLLLMEGAVSLSSLSGRTPDSRD